MAGTGGILEEFGVQISLMFDKAKAEEAQAALKKIGDELRHTAFEAAGAAAALFAIGNNFTSNARQIEEQSDMLGIGTETLQDWEYAAKVVADMNRDELAGSFQHLSDMMDKARAGDQDSRQGLLQLAHAGIGEQAMLQKLSDKTYSVADAAKDLSLGFQNIAKQSPQAATRLAEFAFGNAKMVTVMKKGPVEIQKLLDEGQKQFALSDKMIKQGAEMDRQFTRIWLTMKKFAYEIGFNVMKHIQPLVGQFVKWFAANKSLIASGINGFLDTLVVVMKELFIIASEVWSAFVKIADVFGGVGPTVKLMVEAFLAFKALSALSSVIGIIGSLSTTMIALSGATAGVSAGIAGIGVAAAAVAGGALGLLINKLDDLTATKDKFGRDTTFLEREVGAVGYMLGKVSGGRIGLSPEQYDSMYGKASAASPAGDSSGSVVQENHFHNTNNIGVPHGTSASTAVGIVSRATVDSNEKMMIKAKLDGARKQIQ